jgi:hypothetical protein
MSKPATTIFVFGLYLCALGGSLILAPNTLLPVFGFPSTIEVWIRVLGVVSSVLGMYYVQAARHELVPFFRATIWGRTFVILSFAAFALMRLAPPILILFGITDALGALWTATALRATPAAATQEPSHRS